jgi:pimeloyl-ACP methyl ester carboxylesterase
MLAGMPTTAPTRAPIAAEPAPQPTSAPTPIPAEVVPMRRAPAPAGSNDEGREGSIRREHNKLCNSEKPHGLAETGRACTLATMYVETVGSGPRVVLVHGSGGGMGWPAQRPLAGRYTLVMPARSGYPPNPPLERIDFEEQAEELRTILEPGDHLVGHSYGGVVSLLAAPAADLRSLAVLEPPAFGVARGHSAVESSIAEFEPLWPTDLPPEEFLRGFVQRVGAEYGAPSPLTPEVEASVRAMMVERAPWEAEIPLDALAAAPFPKLVISGEHNAAFDAVCDVLEERLGAERAVLPGAGHSIPRAPGFNERLLEFLGQTEATEPT